MANTDGVVAEGQLYELTLDTGIDLTSETDNVKLHIKDPEGTETIETPSIVSPPTLRLVKHTFAAGELTPIGVWQIKAYLVTQETPGRTFYLEVVPKWEEEALSLPSAQDVRELLEEYGITPAVLSDKWLINRRDRFVVPWVEQKCRLSFRGVKTYIEYKSGTGKELLILNRRPILALTSVEYVMGGGEYMPSLQSIEVLAEEGILKAKINVNQNFTAPMFPRGSRNIKVTYTAGYESAVIPEGVHEAIKMLVAEGALGIVANRTGGGALSVASFGRQYGSRGKFTHIRNELARSALSLLKTHMTSGGTD